MTGRYPFDTSGIVVGADGLRRYEGPAGDVVALLRDAVEEHPDRVAVAEVDGPVMGEKVGAVVLPRAGVTAEALTASLIAFAGDRLADFKVPQFVRVSDGPLPRNAGGKVLKAPLRSAEGWVPVPR